MIVKSFGRWTIWIKGIPAVADGETLISAIVEYLQLLKVIAVYYAKKIIKK